MNARNHVAEVARGRVSALALGALEERVVPRRRQDELVGAADAVRIEPLHGVQDIGDRLTRLRPVLRGHRGRLFGDQEAVTHRLSVEHDPILRQRDFPRGVLRGARVERGRAAIEQLERRPRQRELGTDLGQQRHLFHADGGLSLAGRARLHRAQPRRRVIPAPRAIERGHASPGQDMAGRLGHCLVDRLPGPFGQRSCVAPEVAHHRRALSEPMLAPVLLVPLTFSPSPFPCSTAPSRATMEPSRKR